MSDLERATSSQRVRGKDATRIGCGERLVWFLGTSSGRYRSVLVRDFYGGQEWKVRGLRRKDTVERLKLAIERQCGVPRERQRLYHAGEVLSDLATLHGRNIVRHSVVTLLRLPADTPPRDRDLFVGGNVRSGAVRLDALFTHFFEEGRLQVSQARSILERAEALLRAEPNVVDVQDPVTIVSDIHGQFYDLRTIFDKGGHWSSTPYLFLGDYVDRGAFSCEVTLFLMACKITHPTRFHLLRGNHESVSTTKRMGFLEECREKYDNSLYELFLKAFMALPIAAVVHTAGDRKIFCSHGGIAREGATIAAIQQVNRFVEPTSDPVVRDLLWADPVENMIVPKPAQTVFSLGTMERGKGRFRGGRLDARLFEPSTRGGVVKKFSHEAMCTFLENNDFVTCIRGHQQKPGFEFHRNGTEYPVACCITIFSAPNYTDQSKNTGAIALIRDGVLEIREYGWRIHPCYDTDFVKDLEREDFHQFVHHTEDTALVLLTEQQLEFAFRGVFPRRRPGKRDLWAILKANLPRVRELSGRVTREDNLRRTKAAIAWFSLVDNLKKALEDEESYELVYDDDPSELRDLASIKPERIDTKSSLKDLKDRIRTANWAQSGKGGGDDDDDYDYGDYSDSYY
jgi:hypothetical protein